MALEIVEQADPIIWKIDNTKRIANYQPLIWGNPLVVSDSNGSHIYFNGQNDGLVIHGIPLQGWYRFTIEVLFNPSSDGPMAPRFVHFEDSNLNRGTFEARITTSGEWYMDTFLKNGKENKGLTLIDSAKLHPANHWYWVALAYDGKTMSSYVNGRRELQGDVDFPTMAGGNISLGVRLNQKNWFRGSIKEIRFHPDALDSTDMQHL